MAGNITLDRDNFLDKAYYFYNMLSTYMMVRDNIKIYIMFKTMTIDIWRLGPKTIIPLINFRGKIRRDYLLSKKLDTIFDDLS